jgi:hypothetical protein
MTRSPIPLAIVALLLIAGPADSAPNLTIAIDAGQTSASDIRVGQTLTLSLTIAHTKLTNPFRLPYTPGLVVNGNGSDPNHNAYTFFVTPSRPGDFVIRAFDIRTDSGQVLHVNALTLHVHR